MLIQINVPSLTFLVSTVAISVLLPPWLVWWWLSENCVAVLLISCWSFRQTGKSFAHINMFSLFLINVTDPALSIMLPALLLLFWFEWEQGFSCFPGFCFSCGKHLIRWKGIIISSHASVLFKLVPNSLKSLKVFFFKFLKSFKNLKVLPDK